MLFTRPSGGPALPVVPSRPSAVRRCCEGISLWLAVLFMLSLHPLYAGAELQPPQPPVPVSQVRCPAQTDADRLPGPGLCDGSRKVSVVALMPLPRRERQ